MKIARVAMLGVALAAGGAAAYLASGSKPAPAPQVVQAPASMQTEEVLVAAKELNFGAEVGDGDILAGLGPTPARARAYSSARARTRTRSRTSRARSLLRGTFLAGEPFRRDLLVKGPTAGLMSTMLSTGMRAVAIDIDSQGATKRWFHPAERSRRRRAHLSRRRSHQGDRQRCRDANDTQQCSRALDRPERAEQEWRSGRCWLECDARARSEAGSLIILAQRTGQLSLTLRAMVDANKSGENVAADSSSDSALTIVRFGVAAQSRVR